MVNEERNKKTHEEINKAILEKLNEGPKTAQDIAIGIKSNWKTVKEYLKDLVKDKEVKEISATEKMSYYKRTAGDTYFDLPISEIQRRKFKTLFYMIKNAYQYNEKKLTKTHLAKCSVSLIKDIEELKDLPVVWYLYGAIPQMILGVVEESTEDFPFREKQKIKQTINKYVLQNGDKSSEQLQIEQHENYGQKIYCIVDKLFKELNKKKLDAKEINNLLSKFFIDCPVDPDFPEVFDLSEKTISVINKLILLGVDLNEHKKEVLTTLDSLWKFIALYYLYKSKTEGNDAMGGKVILNFYIGEALEDRKRVFQESFFELNSIYKEVLSKADLSKIKLSEEAKKVAKVMEDFI